MAVRDIIRRYRRAQDITQAQFADALRPGTVRKLRHNTIVHWEGGSHYPDYEFAFYLAAHAEEHWVRQMALEIMREIHPERYDAELSALKITGNGDTLHS